MANEITTRILLNGPVSECERLIATCIQPTPPDDPECSGAEEFFDFETLIPMPADIPDDQVIGWRIENWGVKWGSTCLRDQSCADEIDILFITPNASPVGIFQALAAQFPLLEGDIFSGEWACDWCTGGTIENGTYTQNWRRTLDGEMALTLDIPWDDDEDDDWDEDDEDDNDGDYDEPIGFVAPLKQLLTTLSECRPDELDVEYASLCGDVATRGAEEPHVKAVIAILESLPLKPRESNLLKYLRIAADREFGKAA